MLADGNCYYRALGFGYIEKLVASSPLAIKDFRDHIEKQDGFYKCDNANDAKVLVGHLDQLYDRSIKQGLEPALKLLFKMMIFSEYFDSVSFTNL